MTKHIAILRGDGIGPEIVAETVRVLDKLIAQGLDASYEYAPLGGEAYDEYGHPYPEFTQNLCRKADAVLLGAVGSPQYDNLDRPLRPAFTKEGSVTAANASGLNDGAAALVMTQASVAEALGLQPVARVVAHAAHAHEPGLFTTAPVPAMRKVLAKAGWSTADVDLWEINEAFAVVAMIAMRELGLEHETVNVNGGACALGHPIGASGARILATLLAALEARGGKRGVASLCIGGGEATAMAVERL